MNTPSPTTSSIPAVIGAVLDERERVPGTASGDLEVVKPSAIHCQMGAIPSLHPGHPAAGMGAFRVTVRTAAELICYTALSLSSIGAYMDAANLFDGTPCGITINPVVR